MYKIVIKFSQFSKDPSVEFSFPFPSLEEPSTLVTTTRHIFYTTNLLSEMLIESIKTIYIHITRFGIVDFVFYLSIFGPFGLSTCFNYSRT